MNNLKAEKIAADKGLAAAQEGLTRAENPYSENSPLYQWWDLGWLEFEDDERMNDDRATM